MHKLEQLPPTPVEVLNNALNIANEEGLNYVYTGNIPGSEISDTKCPSCNTILVQRQGYRIASNSIKGGKCSKCGYRVEGVWN
jgi:pyruvate formate lyase activating enzyme